MCCLILEMGLKVMKILGLLFVCCFLVSCGFEPLYVQKKEHGAFYYNSKFDTSITQKMAQIKVGVIADRFGQQLRNNLLDLLTPRGTPKKAKYRLEVELLDKSVTQQALRRDITATSERVIYKVGYQLLQNSDVLVSGDSVAYVSYDILANPYSTTMAQKKTETDAAKIIADDIALRLGAYFHSQQSKKESLNNDF